MSNDNMDVVKTPRQDILIPKRSKKLVIDHGDDYEDDISFEGVIVGRKKLSNDSAVKKELKKEPEAKVRIFPPEHHT